MVCKGIDHESRRKDKKNLVRQAYLPNRWIWHWAQRSRSQAGHDRMWHI